MRVLLMWSLCCPVLLSCCSAPLIALKNLPSGDVGTNPWSLRLSDTAADAADGAADAGVQSQRRNRAQLVATGMYTFYREELALTVGTQEDPAKYGYNITAGLGGQFLQNCLDACDNLSRCAGASVWVGESEDRGCQQGWCGRAGAGIVSNRLFRTLALFLCTCWTHAEHKQGGQTQRLTIPSCVKHCVVLLVPGCCCAGITIRMNVLVEDRPTTCKLIFGRLKLGVHKRTVMR